ncbi:MAG: DUF664 domain-containing protein [Lautropia sp.]|nr:DUF664 domain-containing protein [Lautropia sp.]
MKLQELLIDMAERPRERILGVLDGLTPAQANAFPVEALAPSIKSITWLAWHTAREQDLQIADLSGRDPVWISEGWRERFALDLPDDTEDWHHTPAEAAKVVVPDVELLRGYLNAATDATIRYLRSLSAASLDEVIDRNWTPPVTRAVRLVSILDDASMHSGQAVYARRLLGLEG